MNEFQSFSISLGNDQGQTSVMLLQEKRSTIELVNFRTQQLDHPKIEVKKFVPISLGPLQECIRKKRDREVLQDLLKVQINCDTAKIFQNCQNLQNKVANDLSLLGALMQQSNTDKFIQKTKATNKQAQKYMNKYQNLDKAVSQYTKHQQIIKKFMQQNQCDRQNAIMFLESNNYELF